MMTWYLSLKRVDQVWNKFARKKWKGVNPKHKINCLDLRFPVSGFRCQMMEVRGQKTEDRLHIRIFRYKCEKRVQRDRMDHLFSDICPLFSDQQPT